jgi:hypothetical protein
MITCRTCSHENDDLATICGQCKGYLQNRVPNLDLFETAWGVVTSPKKAFHRIALAEHKNYSMLLFGVSGIGVAFTLAWFFRLGIFFETLLDFLFVMVPAGFVGGMVLGPSFALLLVASSKMVGGKGRFVDTLALVAYAMIPVVLSVLLLLPVELLTFGMFMFTSNPPPASLNPVSFYLLTGLDAMVGVWMLALLVVGGAVVHRYSRPRAAVGAIAALVIGGVGVFVAARELIGAW